jgi:hypothetical protein
MNFMERMNLIGGVLTKRQRYDIFIMRMELSETTCVIQYVAFMREWLSGRALPCQGRCRGFESRLPLQPPKQLSGDVAKW